MDIPQIPSPAEVSEDVGKTPLFRLNARAAMPLLSHGPRRARPAGRLLCLCLFLLLLTGCGAPPSAPPTPSAPPEEENAPTLTFTDGLGRELTLAPPKRAAAMIGSFADVWCLAGGRETLCAAAHDAWTSFDLGLDDSVADLGAVKEPSLELLLASQPDLVLASCNTASNLELLDTLDAAGIPAAFFDVQSFDDYLRMLKICTDLTGCPENFTRYGTDVQARVDRAVERQDGSQPLILCLRATGSSCKIKGSQDFLLGEMLADLDCVNAADRDGSLLDNLSLEAVIAADPDYIFAVLQGADPTRAQAVLEETLLSNPAWSGLRAVGEGRFYILEHKLFNLKPNARWGEAYEILADILYPETAS